MRAGIGGSGNFHPRSRRKSKHLEKLYQRREGVVVAAFMPCRRKVIMSYLRKVEMSY